MKLLHFADLHLDASFAWAPAAVASRRRQAIRDTLREICRVARERNVDALTCAGDLYEQERFTGDTSQFLVSTFAELHPLPILVAPGNHDWLAPSSIYETAAWSSNVHIFRSDRLEPIDLAPGFTVWGGGHRAPANTDDFLHDFRARAFGVNLGLFHASERSTLPHQEAGKQPHAPFSAHEIADAGLDHALLGHYHAPVDGANFASPATRSPSPSGRRVSAARSWWRSTARAPSDASASGLPERSLRIWMSTFRARGTSRKSSIVSARPLLDIAALLASP